MIHFKKNWLGAALISIAIFSSCTKEVSNSEVDNFNREELLINYGKIILERYQNVSNQLNKYQVALDSFQHQPEVAELKNVQTEFLKLYELWQYCSAFNFGPAEDIQLSAQLNTFPTDTVQINNNINSGNYLLESAANIDAKGFPAIDYLLFGIGITDNEITTKYQQKNNEPTKFMQYLTAVSNNIAKNIKLVNQQWSIEGENYYATFIKNSGTDVGSSLGDLVNQFNFDFETIKNPKIGIPLGKKSLGNPFPTKVEAFYSKHSLTLAKLNVKALKDFYLGINADGKDATGLADYLNYLGAKYSDIQLSDAIQNQFEKVEQKLALIPETLSESVSNNKSLVDAAYLEMQRSVILIKTDLPSAMGIVITYQDNDGD